ncbi:hypothetical protein SHL15_7592 [Streptomyces hygroscopicus subsp. limoneus]|nr:hypothetical protein SHL15_7592 [Streptomyces hygroscopicus subsp. limoneus]
MGAGTAEERIEAFRAGGGRFYADVRGVDVHGKAGHFGPYGNPEAWIDDLRNTYRELR